MENYAKKVFISNNKKHPIPIIISCVLLIMGMKVVYCVLYTCTHTGRVCLCVRVCVYT